MDATTLLLKFLKSRRFINDLDRVQREMVSEKVTLRKANDLFIRDAITGLGTILKEDLEHHYYIVTVRIGGFGAAVSQAIILRTESQAEIVAYAHEGLIKRNFAEKTIQKLKTVLT